MGGAASISMKNAKIIAGKRTNDEEDEDTLSSSKKDEKQISKLPIDEIIRLVDVALLHVFTSPHLILIHPIPLVLRKENARPTE